MKVAYLMFMGLLAFLFVPVSNAQRCYSISSSNGGDWKQVSTAPKDGRKVEMLETHGIAPWYELFYWRAKGVKYKTLVHFQIGDKRAGVREEEFTESEGRWVQVSNPDMGVTEDSCLFWRPYMGDPNKYVDPTGGASRTVKYWCDAGHLAYDPKKDSCIAPK